MYDYWMFKAQVSSTPPIILASRISPSGKLMSNTVDKAERMVRFLSETFGRWVGCVKRMYNL